MCAVLEGCTFVPVKEKKVNLTLTMGNKTVITLFAGVVFMGRNQKNYGDVDNDDSQYKFKKHLDKPNMTANTSVGLNLGKFTMNTDFLYKSADAYQYTVTEDLSTTPTTISGYDDFQVHLPARRLNEPRHKVNEQRLLG